MIVWLASYPRSGNTLLRMISKKCFDLCSYEDEEFYGPEVARYEGAKMIVGYLKRHASWDQFYQESSESNEMILVKTHLPPKDNQPFIYIVRDGRSAIQSYKKYYESFLPETPTTLTKLIIGDDVYGEWSTHFSQWNKRNNSKKLLLRFDELVNPSPKTLLKIVDFLNFQGEIKPFNNPFRECQLKWPNFFREGQVDFQPSAEWDDLINGLFYQIHGQLMTELGYPTIEVKANIVSEELISLVQQLLVKQREIERYLHEKENWIAKNNRFTQDLLTELRERGISVNTKYS